jgi:2-polyprenyl-3-methyl-5-hydroxy-6-metoxy-1,4-benzoquinol methylase
MSDTKEAKARCLICSGVAVTPEDNEYIRCTVCGAVRTKYRYDGSQYNSGYTNTYLLYANSPVNQSLNLFRLGLVARYLTDKARILDVGCCVGEFLRFAEKFYHCTGFEPNDDAAETACRRLVSTPILSSLNGTATYDCITLFDVIEHVEEPEWLLRHCNSILNPNGIIALTTPNVMVFRGDETLRKWKHWKPKEHLLLHTPISLGKVFQKVGMGILYMGYDESDIRPGNPNSDLITVVARKV